MLAYQFSASGEADLLALAEWEAEADPERANHILDDLFGALALLREFPALGHARRELSPQSGVRAWVVRPYVLLYSFDAVMLTIHRIVHERADLSSELRA